MEAKSDGTKCMFMPRETNVGKYHKINVANKSFEIVVNFECLVTTLTN
jgi:hypothetical protein